MNMNHRFITRTLGLVAVILLTACARAATPAAPTVEPGSTAAATATQPPAATQAAASPTATSSEIPAAVATSRGPELEATDPTTVSLASGELQFVEFFRFT
jgi:hypothetical protein